MDHNTPVSWKLRDDLQIIAGDGTAGVAWVVKDPLRLRYFRLRAEEMALLKLLDGRSSWGDILMVLKAGFPQTRFSEQNLVAFLVSTINSSLLVSNKPGHGDRLSKIAEREAAGSWKKRFGSLIAFRWRGIDPTSVLANLNALCGWVFRPASIAIGLVFVASVFVFMVSRIDQLALEMPRLAQFITVGNLPFLLAAFVFVKLLHELGHGMACRRFGGECHELGVLFIAFFPLLYCDVSDAWLFRSRWKRVLVSAAGILVELVLAAVFAVLWMTSVPGVFHTFFLNVLLVASVNTLLVNGNPLLRYDGYYVLADSLGLPNLASESRRAAGQFFDRLVFGIRRPRVAEGGWLAEVGYVLFGAASTMYRMFVMVVILWVVYSSLEPYGLEVVAQLFGLVTAGGIVVGGVRAARVRAATVGESPTTRMRAFVGLAIFLVVVALALLVPFPRTLAVPCVLTPGRSTPAYVSVGGQLEESVRVGQRVRIGDTLAKLTNADLERSVAKAEGDLASRRERLKQLQIQRAKDAVGSFAIPAATEAVTTAEAQLVALQETAEDLSILCSRSGTVFPAANLSRVSMNDGESRSAVVKWSGTPLDERNRTAWLEPQTLVCWVGELSDWRLVALVGQSEIPFVRSDAEAEVTFASAPGDRLTGRVTKVASRPQEEVFRELAVTNQIAIDSADGNSVEKLFRVDVAVNRLLIQSSADGQIIAPLYSTGTVRIRCQNESLGSRLWRLICDTFAINAR